jgi:hypothetical protein
MHRRRWAAHASRPQAVAGVLALLLGISALPMAPTSATAPTVAGADEGPPAASWRFAPVSPPAPPPGTPEPEHTYPVPLGQIGDIEFWAPNRGLLITGGTGSTCAASAGASVPCGLYAYNGRGWHVLSTVCGGAQGRIAWAGQDEFWTISDQRPGQVVTAEAEYGRVSLCHFKEGKVVGSYAMPLNQPNSYRPMNAAACLSAENCWFGGELGNPPNTGAFHLHWDGHALTVVYSPEEHEVFSMALAGPNTLLESVSLKVEEGEEIHYGSEDPSHPALLHQIDPPGSSIDFHNLLMPNAGCAASEFCEPLPDYGTDTGGLPVEPATLGPLALASDYTLSPDSPAAPQLWAVAGPYERAEAASSGAGVAHPIALRYATDPLTGERGWTQVIGNEEFGGGDPFPPGDEPQSVAPEPGAAAAWITLHTEEGQAHVARATAQGAITEQDVLGEAQGVGQRGDAGPIACPAPEDCWLATTKGWLFHYTAESEAAQLPEDTDRNFANVITSRPTDDGVLQLPADEPPPDDSLANQAPAPVAPPPPPPPLPQVLANAPVVEGVHTHVLHGNELELSFKLVAEAHVQLIAKRGSHVVAKTPREVLKAGKRKLLLRLNPHRWPNKLALNATALHPLTVTSPGASSGSGPGQSLTAPISAESVST